MRLLVVDDDRALRDVLRRALTLAGYEVGSAETGAGALSEVAGSVPDAVVLDVGLPDIDGLEVCRLLRREGNRVPVLMLTARDAVTTGSTGSTPAPTTTSSSRSTSTSSRPGCARCCAAPAARATSTAGCPSRSCTLDPARHGVRSARRSSS